MTLVFEPRNQRYGGQLVRNSLRMTVIAVLAVSLLGACTPERPAPSPTPSATRAASSPSPSPTAAGEGAATAMDAYRGMWQAYVEAIRIPDPSYPDLARYVQGDALKVFVNGLTSVQQDGLVGEGDVTINPSVIAAKPNASPPTVEIEDCVDTSQSHLVKKDGSPYQDTPGGRRKAVATAAQLDDGSWKVISFALLAVGTC